MYDEFDDYVVVPTDDEELALTFESVKSAYTAIRGLDKEQQDGRYTSITRVAREGSRLLHGGSTLFRQSRDADQYPIIVWMSRVRLHADLTYALRDIPSFAGITDGHIEEVLKLSRNPHHIQGVAEYLAGIGIILVYEPTIRNLKVDGAVFILSSGTPVIAMSLRYNRYDNYWFTLMHELAHVTLHYDALSNPIIDDLDTASDDLIEREANKVAGDWLIPSFEWRTCTARRSRDKDDLIRFCERTGIHPAIVAGRIHRELNKYYIFADIVNSIDVHSMLLTNG